MERSRQDISALHSLSPKGFSTTSTYAEDYQIKASHLFDSSPPLSLELKSVPAPPFMVPAILDVLSNSKYASVTEVVPDEADPYCARAARESGGIILTSDSDMLVYDLGDHGAVAFLNSLEFHTAISDHADSILCKSIKAAICRPRDLARQLDVESLQRLCFEIKEDPHITFPTALQLAKLPTAKPWELQAFLEQYETSSLSTGFPPGSSNEQTHLPDPQTSDTLLQAVLFPHQSLWTSLPILLDNPSKTSAWTPSASLRGFTYAYASRTSRNHHRRINLVLEHSRKGNRIAAEAVQILSKAETIAYASALSARIQTPRKAFPHVPYVLSWRLFALYEVLAWYDDTGKSPPSKNVFVHALTGTAASMWGWEDMHLEAQVQGVLYSLRLVEQTLRDKRLEGKFADLEAFSELAEVLKGLPEVGELLPSRLELARKVPPGFDAEAILDTLRIMLRAGRREIDGVVDEQKGNELGWEELKKKTGKKGREKKIERETIKRNGGVNRFSLLDNA